MATPERPSTLTMPAGMDTAAEIKRGVRRALATHGMASLTEFTLKGGRRADIVAMDGKGRLTIVEVKSSFVVED